MCLWLQDSFSLYVVGSGHHTVSSADNDISIRVLLCVVSMLIAAVISWDLTKTTEQ